MKPQSETSYESRSWKKLSILVTLVFLVTCSSVAFLIDVPTQDPDILFYYYSGQQILSGDGEKVRIVNGPVGWPILLAAFDTLVEDRGLSLSGGERQRLTIARAFACNSRILVFDEGLSAIDKNVKLKILNHLLKIKKHGKIIIIISHQMNTLEIADKIYKIEDSKLKSFSSAG